MHPTRPGGARCTWCDSEFSWAPDLRISCVLLGVRNEPSLADHLVAVLVSPDDHSHDFVETVARNAGPRVTIFRGRARAEQHLTADG